MKHKINLFIILTILFNILPMHIASAYDGSYILNEKGVVIIENGEYYVTCTKQTSNSIYVANDLTDVTIEIENINLRHSSSYATAPISIGKNSNVTLKFLGTNSIVAYDTAAIQVQNSNSTITLSGDGSAKISGGENCAGVGSSSGENAGNITIESGTYEIQGGYKGAAIGGGFKGNGGVTTISGGNVTARSYDGGAAIGGGYQGDSNSVTITDGNINAVAEDGGAAIGGGYRGKGGSIRINGGTLNLQSNLGAYAIGSGRYCTESAIEISQGAEISAYAASGSSAVEETELTCNAIVFSGSFDGDFFQKDDTFTFTSGNNVKTVPFPYGSREIFTTLPAVGDYTVSSSQGNLTYVVKNSKKNEVFTITDKYTFFELHSFCACEITAPEFTVDNIVLSKSLKSKSTTLSAKKSEFTRSDSCAEHTSSNAKIKYTYSIVEDRANIAEISSSRLTVKPEKSGTYYVTVRATATAGSISAHTDVTVTVTREAETTDIEDEDVYITKNGIYNFDGTSKHNAIIVSPGLLDVTLVLDKVRMDLSSNAGNNGSPIVIGAGSTVTISSTAKNVLKSKKDAPVIIVDGSGKDTTNIIFRGKSSVEMVGKGKAECIKGDKNTNIYIADTTVDLKAIDAPAVVCGRFFVSEGSDFTATSNNGDNIINAQNISSTPFDGLNPAYLFQGVLGKALDITSPTSLTLKNTDTKKYATISSITDETESFALLLPDDGYYNCTYKKGTAVQYLTHEDNGENFREFYVDSANTVVELEHSKCKCKLSSPTFKVEAVTIPYDQSTKRLTLYARDSKLTLDKDCLDHSYSNSINYEYKIVEDKDSVATLSDDTLELDVDKPGKYKIKLRATAVMNGITATKDVSVNITKLNSEETSKVRGTEHVPYINGYDDGTFRPDNNVTRAEAATLLVTALNYDYSTSDTELDDVIPSSWYYEAVVTMEDKGFLTGYEDNTFRPNQTMTRAEFSAMICKTMNLKANSKKSKLTDLNDHWATGYISALIKAKVISGYEDNTFKPDNPITRAEAVKIINAVLGRSPDSNKIGDAIPEIDFDDVKRKHWAYQEIIEASTRHYEKELH